MKVYFGKSLISQLFLGIFQKKSVDRVVLTSSIHSWYQIPGNTSKSIQKNCKIWLFWDLHRQFPSCQVLEQNGYDLRNQHPSISQKRIFRSLHFTKNLKIETCVSKFKGNFAENFTRLFSHVLWMEKRQIVPKLVITLCSKASSSNPSWSCRLSEGY